MKHLLLALLFLPLPLLAADPAKPNVLIILADDLGYGDLHCYNPDRGKIPTPNLDRLAAQSLRFTDAHSSSGVCSPSRYTLLTGRYHWRTRLQSGIVGVFGPPLIAPNRLTIASLAKQHGYRTACIGKWHLGWDWPLSPEQRQLLSPPGKQKHAPATPQHLAAWNDIFSKPIPGGPTSRGFDSYFGTDVPNWPPYCFIENDRTVGIPSEFLPAENFQGRHLASLPGPALKNWDLKKILPALADRATAFIAESAKSPNPFLLYMPLTSPHTPIAVTPDWQGTSNLIPVADFIMQTDAVVGQVLDALDKSGATQNTLVIFTSDNGFAPYVGAKELEEKGHYPSAHLRGYKADAFDGGHRIPFIVRYPTVTKPAVCNQLIHHADILATLAEILSTKLPPTAGEDSFSFLPLLKGSDHPTRPHAISCSAAGTPALRQGPWKLLAGPGSGAFAKSRDTNAIKLYDLANDLSESTDLASQHPDRVASMRALLEKLIADGRSTPGLPQPNDIDPLRHPRQTPAQKAPKNRK